MMTINKRTSTPSSSQFFLTKFILTTLLFFTLALALVSCEGDESGGITATSGNSGSLAWTAVANSTFGDSNINAIAYGEGKFVAGGDLGKMAYSSDGINWTAIPPGTGAGTSRFGTASIISIAYGSNRFVAVAINGRMATSPDGVNWTALTTGSSTISAIAYGNGIFVAGGVGGEIAYSK
jgi:hypothetical protein